MKKQIFLLIVLAFLLNLFWEVAHTPLYETPLKEGFEWLGRDFYMFVLLYASFIDMLIVYIIFSIISLKNQGLKWINKPSYKDYLMIILLGLVIAVIIEYRSLEAGRWTYGYFMPVIFGIGLSPLIQLFMTAIIALWLTKK